jgi:antirestriction protein ArdC
MKHTRSQITAGTSVPRDIYKQVTDRIIAMLNDGICPWKRDWSASPFTPRNWNGRIYRGINWLLLGSLDYPTPVFLTYKQARHLGGTVRKGERGHMVTFWKFFDITDGDAPEDRRRIPMLRHYTVFNVAQCDGLPQLQAPAEREFSAVATAEAVVQAMPQRPAIHEDGKGRCYYRPSSDSVHMTQRRSFLSNEGWYSTLFHELAHATGHASRLNRPGIADPAGFASETYSREELVAELTAANICAEIGISEPVIENQAAYIQSWLNTLEQDPKALIWAAGKAARAADWILDRMQPTSDEVQAEIDRL